MTAPYTSGWKMESAQCQAAKIVLKVITESDIRGQAIYEPV
jgi:hypothetical protein